MTWLFLTVGACGLVWAWHAQPHQRPRILGFIAAGGLGFQAVHMVEHVVQVVAWVAAPGRPPFLTPWAEVGAEALSVTGQPGLGEELLHLVGNVVFLVGLVALAGLVRSRSRSLMVALVVQGVHVAEHVALTFGVIATGRAIGVTTLFGALSPGPTLWSVRVLAHLGLNAVATLAAAVALIHILRAGLASGATDRRRRDIALGGIGDANPVDLQRSQGGMDAERGWTSR
jgi:hypothetical protein